MRKVILICLLLLAARPAFAQFGGLGGSSIVFDPSMYARQFDQLMQIQTALQQLAGVGSMFQLDPSFQQVMSTLNQLQGMSSQVQSLLWQVNQWSSIASLSGGCQGWMCANQVQNLASALQSSQYTNQQAQQLYNQALGMGNSQVFSSTSTQMQASQGVTLGP